MTTVQYGGGPTIEQRRAFVNLRPGSHIPGYAGFNPQLKFNSGKTYGEQTAELSKSFPHKRMVDIGAALDARKGGASAACQQAGVAEAQGLRLPKSTGDNKYIDGMLPGYTGYVPTLINRFGGTYRNLCDESVDEFVRNYEHREDKATDLKRASTAFPQLASLRGDPAVRDHLNFWADRKPRADGKRQNLEPPIPGYQGYVPRVYTTQAGLGCRYHEMTRNGLEMFNSETKSGSARVATARPACGREPVALDGNRVYQQEGMKPAYTGYVPRRRFNFGHTYGETTRNLPVCQHSYPTYGNYVRSLTAN
ncbi:hypothetical protein BOX15_Mlig000939g5 [Macrostomum lignano]|uniref:Protein FAM166B n=2 Tax=Macrostomum lignano TaxID=282301 RepID=A0A1I8FW21_9PLAT|nr:hypothetical protein BOX15_Mlig000939g5 [Macrostomum lignano]